MMRFSSPTNPSYRPRRTGSVALMLVLVLTLAVGTFAASVARMASQDRNRELHHQSMVDLEAAVQAVVASDLLADDDDSSISLPLDPTAGRRIVVKRIDPSPNYQATLYQNDQPGLSIRRTFP